MYKQRCVQVLKKRKQYDNQLKAYMNQQFTLDQVAFTSDNIQGLYEDTCSNHRYWALYSRIGILNKENSHYSATVVPCIGSTNTIQLKSDYISTLLLWVLLLIVCWVHGTPSSGSGSGRGLEQQKWTPRRGFVHHTRSLIEMLPGLNSPWRVFYLQQYDIHCVI